MKRIVFVIGIFGWYFGAAAHAADALVDGYHLRPATAAVKTGGTVGLKLVYCRVVDLNRLEKQKSATGGKPKKKPIEDELAPLVWQGSDPPPKREDDLAPLVWQDPVPAPKRQGVKDELAPLPVLRLVCEGEEGYGEPLAALVHPAGVAWQIVSGPGRVSGDRKGATYHAPTSKPSPNEATVTATLSYNVGKEKTILYAKVKILDEVNIYDGTFSVNEVSVIEEYTQQLSGRIRWEFDEYYEEGRWREYTGRGSASVSITRKGCGGPVTFTGVPVEGRLKVHDDKKYEFLVSLVGDEVRKRNCHRPELDKKLKWEETFAPAGEGLSSGDPCGEKEFYPRYTDAMTLAFGRNGSCRGDATNRYQQGWSFQAVE